MPDPLQTALQAQGLPADSLALLLEPVGQAAPVLALQAQRAMAPGSTMKLVTAAVALERLGPNARAATELRATTPPDADGVLHGPLYVRGGGEADLGYAELHQLLRELREQGVRELRGGVVLDRSLFQPERPDQGLPPFDDTPEFPYNVIPDALQLAGSLQRLELQSSAQGVMQGRLSPVLPGIELDLSGLRPAARACADWEDGWQAPQVVREADDRQRVRLQGEFPPKCRVSQALQLVDRQVLWERALRQFWAELGGQWGAHAEVQAGRTPPDSLLLARHLERPLAELLRGLMKRSDNAQTRLLYQRLGAAVARPGEPTLSAAGRAVQTWFAERGIPVEGLVMDNGSGLSRSERISARQMADLLQTVWREQRHLPEFLNTLPVAGEDGTLSRRLKHGPAQGRARLKTGTLRDVVGLAGYLWDRAGRPWVLVAWINHDSPDLPQRGRAVLDAVAEWAASR
ncbi:D-alanyl-D-alanine carboxypeptidase/D-alanyl-D-alanine endopeptidase [Inhella proteolytica]|uniref:D-alanyl-D-alanine carboxypeptidase/D-alanyl-D-alanine-endopeptidase n=1 Tax=Inhella proteolytica TaxID=2795029 RepID=A0A931J1D3_9BURK|nr:D-alanyl-D-alanine carboxypeptidase/D-alanyl-D-alanine-endopeptidase [Inhella proteolytica]MBH9576551.1 D-alanyl-D-alanine carboxypeptidase/D-alanyl-D-alanine-endopeptidase [Inhella proteolytica]